MQAGQLRERIAIEAMTVVADGMGGQTPTWATVATVWGRVRVQMGQEQFSSAADQVQGVISHKVNLRAKAGGVVLTNRHRLVWVGRRLEIITIGDPEGRQREQVVMCREVV
jgi:SPP1 family predicted phage head-tail adaptor